MADDMDLAADADGLMVRLSTEGRRHASLPCRPRSPGHDVTRRDRPGSM
jgi:hypothetical protein